MKKITIAFSIFIFSQSLFSQSWLDVGARGAYGVGFLVNKNFYNDRNFAPKLSYGYMYGGKIGINFNEEHAVTIDVTSSAFDQSFTYSLDSNKTNYVRSIGFNATNFLLMYRRTVNSSYFEIGPQFSMISKTRGSDNLTQTKNIDISENLVKSYVSATIGFGGYIMGTENFGVTLGCRISYSLNDIISVTGQQSDFPSIRKYEVYKSSNPLTAMMMLGFDYDVGYFTKTRCKKKKTRFMLFSNG
jgi:hypothetical protein